MSKNTGETVLDITQLLTMSDSQLQELAVRFCKLADTARDKGDIARTVLCTRVADALKEGTLLSRNMIIRPRSR